MEQLRAYLEGRFKEIPGWCHPQLFQTIQPLDQLQRRHGVEGPVCEIGVLKGKFFIALMKLKQARPHYAIDLFSLERRDFDQGGRGHLNKFRTNIKRNGGNLDDVRILERDSMEITRRDIDRILDDTDGGFSMFSIDGAHTAEHTIHDARTAMALTRPGGIIFVDDYYNANWPGVQEGVCRLYFIDSPPFVPLLETCNKLVLCHRSYHAEYLDYVGDFVTRHFPDSRVKQVKRFGFDNLTITVNQETGAALAPEDDEPATAEAAA
ncbi:MAG: class I SAM-dependent methyltransferase [Sphingomonadaceae bacterium]|nr:class I SAM-dependent methyltransferase [Sphingomonadaceae bacterium]